VDFPSAESFHSSGAATALSAPFHQSAATMRKPNENE